MEFKRVNGKVDMTKFNKTINEAQFALERGLEMGFSYEKLTSYLSDQERDVIEKVIITNEITTMTAYAKHMGKSTERARQVAAKACRKIMKVVQVGVIIPFAQKYLQPVIEETIYVNRLGERQVIREVDNINVQISDITGDILFRSSKEIKELADIANQMYLAFK
jgi:RNA 3'-terminal phosphate cyclase